MRARRNARLQTAAPAIDDGNGIVVPERHVDLVLARSVLDHADVIRIEKPAACILAVEIDATDAWPPFRILDDRQRVSEIGRHVERARAPDGEARWIGRRRSPVVVARAWRRRCRCHVNRSRVDFGGWSVACGRNGLRLTW